MPGRLTLLALSLTFAALRSPAQTPHLTPVITSPYTLVPNDFRLAAPITFAGRILPADATGTLTFTIDGVPSQTLPLSPHPIADYIALGDSITAAPYIADPAQRYPAILAPALHRDLFNYALPNATACDLMPLEILPNAVGASPAFNPLYSVVIGTNDLANFSTGPHEQIFNLCHQAALGWVAIPPENKILLGTTVTPGNTTHLTLTTTGAPAYLWYGLRTSNSVSFNVSVDGAPFTSTQSAALDTATSSYALLRIPVPAGTHTIDISAVSGPIEILGMGSPPTSGGPIILAGDIPNQTSGDTTGIAAYTADIQSNITLLDADGLDIRFVPTQRSMLATPAEMMDSTHPNALGLAELAAAFQAASPATATTTVATANFTTSTLPLGTHAIGIHYSGSGDTRYAPISSAPIALVIYDPTSSATLTSDNSTYPAQSPILLTASVPQPNASGLVTFTDENGLIGSAWLHQPTLGLAQLTLSSLPAGIHTLSAQYLGDARYNTSTSLPITINVAGTYTATALTVGATRYFAATPITLTANVSPAYATGTVTFSDSAILLGQSALVGGTSTLSANRLAPGIHSLTAAFSGNATQDPSQSPTLYLEIDPNSTTTSLSPLPASSPYGTFLQLLAVVSPIYATGSVTFSDGSLKIGQSAIPNAALTISTLPPGTHTLTATYSGDTEDLPSISLPITALINLAPSAISLAPIPASRPYGTPLQLLPAVSPTYATGTVTFFDGQMNIGQSTLPNAALSISNLTPGAHSVTATYSGDGYRIASTSAAISTTITPFPATVILAPLPATIGAGNPLTLTATLSPSTASGTVLFRDATLGILGQSNASHGAATLTFPSLTPGPYSITATYSGDANDTPANSNAATTQVLLNTTSTTLTTSASNVTFSTPSTLRAAIYPATATGSVTFFDGASILGTAIIANGIASLPIATLTPGTHLLHASYGGDTLYSASTSLTIAINIALDATVTTFSFAQNNVAANTLAIANVRVSSSNTNPTGTVSLRAGAVILATGPVSNASNGFAYATLAFSPAALGVGQSPITAFYSGDSHNLPSDSSAVTNLLTVTTIPTAATLTLSAVQIAIQQNTTLTATVAAPTGTITFAINGIPVSTAAVSPAGIATYTLTGTTIGTIHLTASYAATGIYAASTSPPQTLTMTPPLAAVFSPTSVSLIPGATVSATLTLTPLSGFTGPIQTTCKPAVSFITCTLTAPATLTSTAAIPVQITIAKTTASLSRPGLATIVVALLLPFLIRRKRRHPFMILLTALTLQGCAEGGNFFSIPPGAQTVTIITTAAGTTVPATLTIAIP